MCAGVYLSYAGDVACCFAGLKENNGTSILLHVQLDEPGTIFYLLGESAQLGECPDVQSVVQGLLRDEPGMYDIEVMSSAPVHVATHPCLMAAWLCFATGRKKAAEQQAVGRRYAAQRYST